jgi:hypothetical protein
MARAETGLRMVKDRHLAAIARDLAENGVEVQRYLVLEGRPSPETDPLTRELGTMAGRRASFRSFTRVRPDGLYEIISTGTLADAKGRSARSLQLTVIGRPGPDGTVTFESWSETARETK